MIFTASEIAIQYKCITYSLAYESWYIRCTEIVVTLPIQGGSLKSGRVAVGRVAVMIKAVIRQTITFQTAYMIHRHVNIKGTTCQDVCLPLMCSVTESVVLLVLIYIEMAQSGAQ